MKLAGLLSLVAAEEITRYDGDKVYGFNKLTNGVIAHLKVSNRAYGGLDFWSPDSPDLMYPGGNANIRVPSEHTEEFEALMASFDIDFNIRSPNLQLDIDMERMNLNRQGRAHSLTNFNDFETIEAYVKSMGNNDNVKYVEFGKTPEGRNMMALEIGTGSKAISIDCGIHAREWVADAYCQWFINEAINGGFAQYTNDVTFIVQPTLNPDGYAYTWTNQRMWRKNRSKGTGQCYGVDLNRNYDANWGGPGASGQSCSDTFRGTAVFSEMESQAQRDYLATWINNGSLKAYLTFHAYGQYILYPYSYDYTSTAPNKAEMNEVGTNMEAAVAAVHRHRYTMGQGTDVLYAAAGGSDDWCYDAMQKAGNAAPLSYTVECRDTGTFGFVLPAAEIQPNCEELDAGLKVLVEYVIANK